MKTLTVSVSGLAIVVLLMVALGAIGCSRKIEKGEKTALLMDKYQGPTVTVSGKVLLPDYKSGTITISASHNYYGFPDIALTVIPCPGEYSLRVPKNFGNIYIRARSFQPGERPNRDVIGPSGRYSNNPLKIGSFDIKGVDLVITPRSLLLMDFYPGPTVTISGKVIFSDYESGPIAISVSSKTQTSPDIAITVIPGPGEYALRVPKNFGDMYLWAMNLVTDEKAYLNRPMGKYKQNPLRVGRYDIQGIDIVF